MWLNINSENFNQSDLYTIKNKLETIDESKFILIQGVQFQNPSTILVIAILLGWERFWLNDIALGILKLITCYGCFLWWFIDIFTAKSRARSYNYQKLYKVLAYM